MPEDDQMTLPERLKYLRLIQPRYRAARRAQRSAMLTEPKGSPDCAASPSFGVLAGTCSLGPGVASRAAATDPKWFDRLTMQWNTPSG